MCVQTFVKTFKMNRNVQQVNSPVVKLFKLTIMKMSRILVGGCLLVTVVTACSKTNESSLNDTDRNFLVQAGYSNMAEIDAGSLAATKGSRDSVKMYGTMMVSDHTTANNELKAVADPRGVTLPTAPDAPHQAIKQQLMAMAAGKMFDTAYINGQVRDHQATIALFNNEVANGKDQTVKNLASGKLPTLQAHLTLANTISAKLPK